MAQYDSDEDPYVVIERHSGGVGSFLLGIAVGAGLALLFAPQSGDETRRDIRLRARRARRAAERVATDVADSVTDTFGDARRRVEEQIDSARQAIDLKREQVNRAVEAGRLAAEDARVELEQRIAEAKADGAGASPPPVSPYSG
jgi:gas vesicle protein